MVRAADGEHATGFIDLLAIGFGTTVAMWAVGYVGHMPLTNVPPLVFVSCMLVCLVVGGWIVGQRTPRGLRGGAVLGLVVAVLNLLVLGSILAKPNDGQIVPQAWLWVPGYFAVCVVLATAGAVAGTTLGAKSDGSDRSVRSDLARPAIGAKPDWLLGFAWTACAATLLLILSGGLVTGFRAGMAVVDWPNTFGFNMFLYPLAKMTGGVFYEHAHRLLGALVGFTTLTFAIILTIRRRSLGALVLVWIVGFCVLLQGVMGGIRVIDSSPEIRAHLAVVHGFFAHLILAGMIGVAVLISPRAKRPSDNSVPPSETDGFLAALLVVAILGQTLMGTLVRQMDIGLMIHLTLAMLVAVLAIVVGVRMWGLYPHIAVLARGGVALMGVVVLQILLGGTALIFRTPPAGASPSAEQLQAQADAMRPAANALLTTAHQTTAAVLLAIAALLAFWTWRLLARDAAKKVQIVVDTDAARVAT
jgi:cytochrome c oxidase assembly protein subunit 15